MTAYIEEYALVQTIASLLLGLPGDADASTVQAIATRAGHWAGIAVGRALRQRQTWRFDVDALPLVQRARAAIGIQQRIEECALDSIKCGIDDFSMTEVSYYDLDVQAVKRFEPYYDEAPEFWFEAASTERPEILQHLLVDDNGKIRSKRCDWYVSASMKRIMSNEAVQQRFVDVAINSNNDEDLRWFRDLLECSNVPLKCKAPDCYTYMDTEMVHILKTIFEPDSA